MHNSPFKELQIPQGDKKFPAFYGKVNVHRRAHNSPPLLPILNYVKIFIYLFIYLSTYLFMYLL